ncbi:MAG: hypothetical protein AMXMBFR64_42880 [Myxococcales bacterium]
MDAPPDLRLARCPVCRLALDGAPAVCPRCEGELALVHAAYAGAWSDVLLARRLFGRGEDAAARAAAWRAVSLARTPTTLATFAELSSDAAPQGAIFQVSE